MGAKKRKRRNGWSKLDHDLLEMRSSAHKSMKAFGAEMDLIDAASTLVCGFLTRDLERIAKRTFVPLETVERHAKFYVSRGLWLPNGRFRYHDDEAGDFWVLMVSMACVGQVEMLPDCFRFRHSSKWGWLIHALDFADEHSFPLPPGEKMQQYCNKVRATLGQRKTTMYRRWSVTCDGATVTVKAIGKHRCLDELLKDEKGALA